MQIDDVKLSCLVCTLTAPLSIDQLIDSLAAQDWVTGDEIVVVDNGEISPTRRAEIEQQLADFSGGGIAVQFPVEQRTSVVQARITAIQASSNPWLIFLDDDNLLAPGAFRQIRRRVSTTPTLGAICPRVEPVWEVQPKPWVVLLGHQVLGYNTSELHEKKFAWQLWEPGVVGQRPPGGGMIIKKSVANEFVQLCNDAPIILTFTPGDGRRMTGEDFILYSLAYMDKDLATAYDDSIIVRHQIPQERTTFSSLLTAMFWTNYCFAIIGLMRRGKSSLILVLIRGLGRLVIEFFRETKRVASVSIFVGYVAGAVGFVYGVLAGLFNGECVRIRIDP